MSSSIYFQKVDCTKGYINFCIKKILLAEGVYQLSFYSECNHSISDFVENAARFNVVFNDFYNTGMIPPIRRLSIITEFEVKS